MHVKSIVIVAVCLFGALAQAQLSCNCGLGIGKDICNPKSGCSPMVVRPQKLESFQYGIGKPKTICKEVQQPLNILAPIGNPCACSHTIVKPAVVPKLPCKICGHKSSQTSTSSVSSSAIQGSSILQHCGKVIPYYPGGQCSGGHCGSSYPSAADPVSVQLAMNLQKQAGECVTESSLNFGFKVLPQEVPKQQKSNHHIKEEGLFRVNGEIVELKPVAAQCGKTLEEEAIEDLKQIDEEAYLEEAPVKQLSYDEIGYRPAAVKTGNFVQVAAGSNNAAITSTSSVSGVGFGDKNCNNGFVPGQVIVKSIPSGQAYETTKDREGYLFEDDEDEDLPLQYPTFKYSSSAASSSCSSSNKHTSSSAFGSIGCH